MNARRMLACLVTLVSSRAAFADDPRGETLSLAGEWRFQLDPEAVGVGEEWFGEPLDDVVRLPGTTEENRKGIPTDERATDRLSRTFLWKGPAWYQRDVTIPSSWKGKRITLFLERTKNTRVWVDRTFCGWDDTLSAPQIFDVTKGMTPGTHTITMVIDNSRLPPVGPAHAIDERTQTNWNGVVGRLELRATDPVWIADAQVHPDAGRKEVRVRVTIGNGTGRPAAGSLALECESFNVDEPRAFGRYEIAVEVPEERAVVDLIYPPGADVPPWDEFQPALLRLSLALRTRAGQASYADDHTLSFGMRTIERAGNRIRCNGRPLFLRGRTDCANYPMTGYPPMDVAGWRRVLSILKTWGLNHVRFHSWCPPEAAFQAADELGFYLQAELPNKRSAFKAPEDREAALHNIDRLDLESSGGKVGLFEYAEREGESILRHFGNHPSFVMFTLGNELGRTPGMFELVAHFRATDPRHLYAQGANNMHWNPSLAEGDDFWVTGKVAKDAKPLRGSFSVLDFDQAPLEAFPPSTTFDFGASIDGIPVPMIGHETGQYQVYPDYRGIAKFRGVLRARNYEIFRERLAAAGMLDQAHDFVRASGALSAICYRADMEMALRTRGMAGFQLLDLQDFPGQGTALVGMLDVFMDDKGVVDPAVWRQSCSATVLLARMAKFTWTETEAFAAELQVAHHGPLDLVDVVIRATLTDRAGRTLATAVLPRALLATGDLATVGEISWDLATLDLEPPVRLDLGVAIDGTEHRNTYPLWIYPEQVDTAAPPGVLVTRSFQAVATRAHLATGGAVLLLPELEALPRSVAGGFQTEFWSPMFARAAQRRGVEPPPGTLGILCDPDHPVFARFPTEFHTNWQWWHLVKNARPIVFDGAPPTFRPIVQVIDNFDRNHRLGLLAETRVGRGRLLICPIDLQGHTERPAVRQFLHSVLHYVGSDSFAPSGELPLELLNALLPR